jgi:hypothetical protein
MAPSLIEDTPMFFAEDTANINFWIPLKQNKNYEINDVSLKIRCVETKREICFYSYKCYKQATIDGKTCYYHRLIAEMFVYNPDPLTRTCVDHIDRNKHNNTIENLHWVTPGENNINKSKCYKSESIFVKSLPVDARQLTHYKGNELKYQYFISNNSVFIKTESEFRQLNVIKEKTVYLQYKRDDHSHPCILSCLLNENTH